VASYIPVLVKRIIEREVYATEEKYKLFSSSPTPIIFMIYFYFSWLFITAL
jgi:hypothetical protein